MFKFRVLSATVACFAIAAATAGIHASGHGRTLVVTMTNDQDSNQIKIYDAESHALLQTLSTHGKGGVGGNARGIKQYDGRLVAAVNNGSGNVALFRRDGDVLKFDKLVQTTSAPVGVDFGNDSITTARPQDLARLPAIELAAALLLARHVPESVLNETTDWDVLQKAQQEGRLCVALADDVAVGFAHVEVSDGDMAPKRNREVSRN